MGKFEDEPNRLVLELVVDHAEPEGGNLVQQTVQLIDAVMWLLAVRGKMKFRTTPDSYRVINGKVRPLIFDPEYYTDIDGIVEGLKSQVLDDLEYVKALVENGRAATPLDERQALGDLPGGLSYDEVRDLLELIFADSSVAGKVEKVDIAAGDLDAQVPGKRGPSGQPSGYVKRLWKANARLAKILGRDTNVHVRHGAARIGMELRS
jgi:hypothetical protein